MAPYESTSTTTIFHKSSKTIKLWVEMRNFQWESKWLGPVGKITANSAAVRLPQFGLEFLITG